MLYEATPLQPSGWPHCRCAHRGREHSRHSSEGPLLTCLSPPLLVLIPWEVRGEGQPEAAPAPAHIIRSGPNTRPQFHGFVPVLSPSPVCVPWCFQLPRRKTRTLTHTLSPKSPNLSALCVLTLPACQPIQTRSIGPRVPLPSHTLGHTPFPGEKHPRLWSLFMEEKEVNKAGVSLHPPHCC